MNSFIYKYPLTKNGSVHVSLPIGAQLLSVCEVAGELVLYAAIDPNTSKMQVHILYVVGTGWQLAREVSTQPNRFMGTVAMTDGLVWHVFHFPPAE
jgi:hypothetical protein